MFHHNSRNNGIAESDEIFDRLEDFKVVDDFTELVCCPRLGGRVSVPDL